MRSDLASRKITVTGSVAVLQNLVFVAAPASRVAEMQNIPGVVSVKPMRRFKPALNRATQLVNAPAAWTTVGGAANAGAGIKIGILDSGIDQNHPAFQDSSLTIPAGFPKCTTGHPEDCAFTNNKVIVARSYVRLLSAGSKAANPAADDLPDDYSPRDRDGHGTAVASVAAAVKVTTRAFSSDGQALVIQGMAPKAWLGSYKIAGSPGVAENGSDQTLIQAVEDAVADGMDVITTSFGSAAISDAASDPVAAAFEAAAKTGAVVIAAAGNGGGNGTTYPSFNSILSPSNAPDVISVGATENSHVFLPAVSVNAPSAPASLKGIPAQPSDTTNYPSTFGATSANLIDVAQLGNDGTACAALPAHSLDGAFALIERSPSGCAFATKAANAENAGAIGIVFYMSDGTAPFSPTGLDPNVAAFQGPAVMIANAAGVALKSFIDANPGQSVTIDSGGTETELSAWIQTYGFSPPVAANMLASFSSTGPTPDGQLKPDIVATGGNDLSLEPYPNDPYIPSPSGLYMATQSYDPNQLYGGGTNFSANGYWAANGSSFSAPLAAGAAALAKQAHAGANLRGTQIKSLVVNSASQNTVLTDDYGDPVDAQWIGAGLLNAGAAATATITSEPSTVSFGVLKTGGLPVNKNITLTNIGASTATLSASVNCCYVNGTNNKLSGTQVVLGKSSLSLAPGAATTLSVSLTGTVPAASEYSGTIALQQGSSTTSIPFMFLVGDGVPSNVNIISAGGEGAPGEDVGPTAIQVVDQYGVPVANAPVSFTVTPAGSVTLTSVPSEPGCTPASSTSTVTCNTDQFGVAYAEVVLGSTAGSSTVTFSVGGISIGADCSFLLECYNIQAPPAVTGVVDAASFQKTLAPGSYAAIFGTGLSNFSDNNGITESLNTTPTAIASDPVVANGAVLPLQIDYVTVSFDVPSAGISVAGHPTYVSPGQVNVQIPWELAGQSSAQMKVTLNGDLIGNVVTVPIANAAPAFFVYNGTTLAALDTGYNLITASNPAKRGKIISLYANGLGPVANTPPSGNPAGSTSTTLAAPVVAIGGQNAPVSFSGLTPSLPGLYQLNVTVPTGINAGIQNVTVTAGGVTSPVATISVQ
ncbi:MAG: S8 family serine peptidase [Acidobacteriota bacterium]|nr:S8 family serine peptidase [Acidobacteriota bacterium]